MMYKKLFSLIVVAFISFGVSKYFNTLEHHMAENTLVCTTSKGVVYSHVINSQNGVACVLVWNLYSKKDFIDVDNR